MMAFIDYLPDDVWDYNECLGCGNWHDFDGGLGYCETCADELQGRAELEACATTPEAEEAVRENG